MNGVTGTLSGNGWDQSAVYVGEALDLGMEEGEQVAKEMTANSDIENSAAYNGLQLPAVKDNLRLFANNPYILSVIELADKLERQIKLDYAYDVIKKTVQQLADTLNCKFKLNTSDQNFFQ